MRRIPDGSKSALRLLLSTKGTALSIAGSNARLPTALRRWDPSFAGAHAVCVVPLGGDFVTWYDPLATPGYAGERVSVDTVLTWAFIPSDARIVKDGEFLPPKETAAEREERLAAEVVKLRNANPRAAKIWVSNTGMTQAVDGRILQRIQRLSAEVTYLREYNAAHD